MDTKSRQKLLLCVLPINGFILAFVLLFFASRASWASNFSPSAFSSPIVVAFSILSMLILLAGYKLSGKFLSAPSGSMVLVALPETIVILGLVAAFLAKNTAIFWPFFLLWLVATVFALKAALKRIEN
ncbi:MAG: hypothetical protein NTY83_02470 [Candidatus Micrarchaeota archaeon]|nr:hypothetical protein [Candidatus Micrarchaeota archaeon]